MSVEELVNRFDDLVAAVQRIADALEAISAPTHEAVYDEAIGGWKQLS